MLTYNAISPLTPNHSKNLVHDLKKNLTKRENRADWQAAVDVKFNKTKQTVFDQRPQSFVSLFVLVFVVFVFVVVVVVVVFVVVVFVVVVVVVFVFVVVVFVVVVFVFVVVVVVVVVVLF